MYSGEPLRFFSSLYIATNLAAWKGEDVSALMEEGGDFVIDVSTKASQRMEDMEGRLERALENTRDDVLVGTVQTKKRKSNK